MWTEPARSDAPPEATAAIVVAILTYRRPAGLRRTLDAITRLRAPDGASIRVLVVDNDPEGTGEAIIDELRDGFPFVLDYQLERRRGISHARNRAVAAARSGPFDWLAFVDDDDAPSPDWLARLVATQAATGADVVMGPLHAEYEPGGAGWVVDGNLMALDTFAHGQEFPFYQAHTSGTLVRASALPPGDEVFDERLSLTGGEDRMLFTRIHRAGGRFVWDEGAVVTELVPASRARLSWLTRRWFRIGVTRSLVLLYLDDAGALRRARRVLGGLAIGARGVVRMVTALPTGRAAVARGLRLTLIGLGASAGAVGFRYQEYRETHGT